MNDPFDYLKYYSKWALSNGKMYCPICESVFEIPERIDRYRHCPFCGSRLNPPGENEDV